MIWLFFLLHSNPVGEIPPLTEAERAWISRMGLPPTPASPSNRVADHPQAVALGKELFFATDLSPSGSVACASCHIPEKAFTDGLPTSRGKALVARNAPTVLLAAHQRWMFWDGRADSLWNQATKPLEDPREMGVSRGELAAWLSADPQRLTRYEALFGPLRAEPPQAAERMLANVGKALEAFERSIEPPQRPWDQLVAQLLAGETAQALTPNQIQGMRLFVGKAGCATCHAGPLFSDLEFHDTRLPQESASPEPGRFQGILQVKKDPLNQAGIHSDDRMGMMARWLATLEANSLVFGSFKTPSLRFVSLTAPYMHDGSMPDLDSVIAFYNDLSQARPSHHPEPLLQPIHLSPEERVQLRSFLESL